MLSAKNKQNFVPYQKNILAGIPKTKHAKKGLFCHQSQTNCEFPANHPTVCPAIKKDIAYNISGVKN